MRLLIGRNRLGLQRDPMQSRVKIMQQVIFAVIVAMIFNDLGFHHPNGLEGKVDVEKTDKTYYAKLFRSGMELYGGLFFVGTNVFMGNLMNTILVFQRERPVFLREQANKMYSVGPYFSSKIIMDTPVLLIAPMFSTFIIYFAVGLETTFTQFIFFYVTLLMQA